MVIKTFVANQGSFDELLANTLVDWARAHEVPTSDMGLARDPDDIKFTSFMGVSSGVIYMAVMLLWGTE